MIKYVLIDWDNTVWDFSANSALSLSECYVEFGLDSFFESDDDFATRYYAANDALWARYRAGEVSRHYLVEHRFYNTLMSVGISDMDLARRLNGTYLEYVEYKSELVPGAVDVVEYLRARGYVLVVVTNGFSDVQRRKLRNSGIQHLFDYTVLSEDAGALKPSREFFDYVFRHTGAVPGQSIVIGDDAESDISGAVKYGLKCVYFNRFGHPCPYPADYEISSLYQLKAIL